MILFGYILFFLLSVFSFYIPGKILINVLKLPLKNFESLTISYILGISLFLLGTYLFSWIQIPQLYLLLLICLNLYFLYTLLFKKNKFPKFSSIDYVSLLIIIFGSLSFLYVMFFSGLVTSRGIQFVGVNGQDGIRHIAYIKNQVFTFPPQHPELSGVELKGFHYFYDLLLAKFAQFYNLSVEDLYFRFFPILISLLYGASFYLFSIKMTKNIVARRLIVFFAYFAKGFSVIYFLFVNKIDLTNSPIVHPISLIVNPFVVLGIAMLVASLALLPDAKKSLKSAIIIGIMLGVLCQVKVYTGLIGIGVISLFSFYIFLRHRKKYLFNFLVLLSTTAILTIITFFPNNFRQGGLAFYPLLFYSHYISRSHFENFHWDIRRMIFEQHNNYLRIAILYIEAIVFFWIYNLGVLSIIFIKIKSVTQKKFWTNEYNFIVFWSIIIPIIIGSFFIQSVSAFDTVQFFWIVIPLLGIPAGITLANILPKNKIISTFIILFIVVLSLPGYLDFMLKYNPLNVGAVASKSQLQFLKKVSETVPDESFIIYIPGTKIITADDEFYEHGTPVISALTGKKIYLEGGGLPGKLDNIHKARFANIVKLNTAIESCDTQNISKYIMRIGSKFILSENKYNCLEKNTSIEKINSKELTLYILKND